MQFKTRSNRNEPDQLVRFTDILENIREGFFVLDHDWRFSYVNHQAASNLGFKPQELIGQNLWQKLPQIIDTDHETYYRMAMTVRQPREFEWYNVRTNNWYNIRVHPSVEGLSVYWQDITDYKLIGENLKETQDLCRVGSWVYDIEKQKITWSAETYVLYERDPKLGPPTPEEDSRYYSTKQYKALRENVTKAIETGRTISYDIEVKLPSKKPAYYYATIHPLKNIQGQVFRLYGVVQDITERKQAEEQLAKAKDELEVKVKEGTRQLKKSEEKYRLLIDNASEVITVVQDGVVKFMNKKGLEIIGYSSEEIVGKPFLEFVHADDRKVAEDQARRRFEGEVVLANFEYGVLPKDGRSRWAQMNGAKITWDGKPAILAMFTDITERKQAEEKIKSMFGFRDILTDISINFINVPIERLDKAISDAQRRICEYLDLDISSIYQPSPETAPSLKLTYIYRRLAKPSLPQTLIARDYFPWCEQQLVSGKTEVVVPSTQKLPAEAVRDKASWQHYGIKSSLMFPLLARGGEIVGTLSFDSVRKECPWPEDTVNGLKLAAQVFANAIARKQSEEMLKESRNEYQALIETTSDFIWEVDTHGMYTYCSPQIKSLWGYEPEEMLGKSSLEVIVPEDRKKASETLAALVKSPKPFRLETNGYSKQKQLVITETGGVPFFNEAGKLLGFRGITRDITERKMMEQELKNYILRITEVQEEERKRIAYELHDDTAQYLSILKMQLNSLLHSDKIEKPEVLEKLRYLEKDADQAFQDVRRYSHELRPVTLERMGLQAALEQIVDDYNKLGQISIKMKVGGSEPELPENVKLGFYRIAQEALNNIRKHSKASQATIILTFQENRLEMSVSDDGTGFNINEAATRSGGKGSLGLLSMKERAELIGASLNIDSKPGQGTTIRVDMSL